MEGRGGDRGLAGHAGAIFSRSERIGTEFYSIGSDEELERSRGRRSEHDCTDKDAGRFCPCRRCVIEKRVLQPDDKYIVGNVDAIRVAAQTVTDAAFPGKPKCSGQ